jgi:light-regulated signal transduction histidine kinase (bacteriophytochrome)
MIGQAGIVLNPPGHDYEMPEAISQIMRGERIAEYQAVRRTKNGNLIRMSVSVSPLHNALGQVIGVSKIARDLTEQLEAATRLAQLNADLQKANERLARSNEDLERFAFIASHDLQEPLRMITVYSQLLQRTSEGTLGETGSGFLANVVDGARRMRQLLADLLAYAEIGADPLETRVPVDLNAVLIKVLGNLKAMIDESGAVITSGPLPQLRMNEGHLIPLLQNLISNAIKYRAKETPHVRVNAVESGASWEFEVTDNGLGIEREYHEKIFTAFTRLHGKNIPGTGIGLAICQRIVQRYGGRIWVVSELGNGSTFHFTLPAVLAAEEASA